MESTRQAAIEKREMYYFTGVACGRGHLAKRYTRNGSCYECLHPSFTTAEQESKRARRQALSRMVTRKFRVTDADLESFETVLRGLALSVCPHIKPEDLKGRSKPLIGSLFSVRAYRIFPELEPYLRALEPGASPAAGIVHEGEQKARDIVRQILTPSAPASPADYWPEHDPR